MASKKKNIYVNGIDQVPVPMRQIEIVERKGVGHPDSVADNIAETVSQALCRMYKGEVGHVLHHNTDQTEVVAGRARSQFGGGCIIKPVYVLMDGRATTVIDKKGRETLLPVESTALRGVREMLRREYPLLDLDSDIILDTKLGMGSDDLTGVYKASNYLSNDTSFGVGYAPFSITDSLTYETERFINGRAYKKRLPEAGQDVKVMCSRVGDRITMTIACAMVDRFIDDRDHYRSAVDQLAADVNENALDVISRAGSGVSLKVEVNTGDDYKRGVLYATVTGLSQENGDDGSVGRGNRCNGLITPYRPMSMEATSGKNPITHVGKIYNVLSSIIAKDVARKVKAEAEIHVRLLSQIGHTISDPLNAAIDIIAPGADENPKLPKWRQEAYSVAADWLDNIDKVSEDIINGKIRTFRRRPRGRPRGPAPSLGGRNEDHGYSRVRADVPVHGRQRVLLPLPAVRRQAHGEEEARRAIRRGGGEHEAHPREVPRMGFRDHQADRHNHHQGRPELPRPGAAEARQR